MSDKLGGMLLQAGLIGKGQLASALEYQKSIGGKLGVILVKLNFIKEERLAQFLAEQMKLAVIRLKDRKIDPALMKLIPREIAEKHEILPISREGDILTIVTPDPTDYPAIDELAFLSGLKIQTALATRTEVTRALQSYYYSDPAGKAKGREAFDSKKAAPEAEPATPTPSRTPVPAGAAAGTATPAKRGRAAALSFEKVSDQPLPARPIEVNAERLSRALAGLLIEKNVITLNELLDRVGREG
jgi:hypothetical protein